MCLRFVVVVLLASGCTDTLGSPLRAFHEGRLPEAAAEFRLIEPEVASYAPAERARYALYRGLAHLGLGDSREADRWLSLAKRLERITPECFDPTERGELHAAWRSLGRMPGEE